MMVEAIVFFYLGGVVCMMGWCVRVIRDYGWKQLHWGLAVSASVWASVCWPYYAFWKAVR